jgi:tetratricopeptide (TPR) repeat protein
MEHWRYYLRGRLFEAFRRPAAAVNAYGAALRLKPDFYRCANRLAYTLASLQRFGEAETYFRVVLRFDPVNAVAHFNLAYTCQQLGWYEQAIQAFQESTRLNDKIDRAWYGLGLCYAHLGRHVEAAAALEKAAGLQPMNPHAWYALGMAQHAAHQPDRVKEVTLHLVRFDPRMARRLILEAERSDLNYLVRDLAV